MKRTTRNSQPTRFGFFLKLIIVLFVVFSIVNITAKQIELSRRQQILKEKQAEEAAIKISNAELSQLLESGTQDVLVERVLRENGYVRADERVYVDLPNG